MSSNLNPTSSTNVPPSQIEVQINTLAEVVDALETASANLAERLTNVVRPYDVAKEQQADRDTLVPLAEEVRTANEKLIRVRERLNSLVNRLEI